MELYTSVLLDNLKKVREQIEPTFNEFFQQHEKEIRQLIKERWLLGKRPDGSLIGSYSSMGYALDKHSQNPTAGFYNVDLIRTGDLVDAIKISLVSVGFEIFSTDEKYNKISSEPTEFSKGAYGKDNFNLTDEQTEEIISKVSVQTLEFLYNKYIT